MVTKETRLASYLERPANRKEKILDVFREAGSPLTARQVLARLGGVDMNSVRPRITELLEEGRLEAVGKVTDGVTGRPVAVFAEVRRGE